MFRGLEEVEGSKGCKAVFFLDIVRIFCLMSEVFGAISNKVFDKVLLNAQQYACGGFVLIIIT